jgi:hypothetical protein
LKMTEGKVKEHLPEYTYFRSSNTPYDLSNLNINPGFLLCIFACYVGTLSTPLLTTFFTVPLLNLFSIGLSVLYFFSWFQSKKNIWKYIFQKGYSQLSNC